MHYQAAPHAESKLVRCVRGRIFDVAVDLRPDSPTLSAAGSASSSPPTTRRMLVIPEGFAHGFLTLDDDSDVLYLMGRSLSAGRRRGVRWNDPAFAIAWPAAAAVISPRDESFSDYQP